LPHNIIIHSSQTYAIVSSLDGERRYVIGFALEKWGWTRSGVTWFGEPPPVAERDGLIEEARQALLAELKHVESGLAR
jgi:hypothetical protein